MIKEIKYGGMSNVPGDYECADGELAVAVNVVNENGELRPFVHPDPFMAIAGTLMFVHKGPEYENFITLDGSDLYFQTRTSIRTQIASSVGNVSKVEALGNILVVVSDQPIIYRLYREGNYTSLGSMPPELSMSFGLSGALLRGGKEHSFHYNTPSGHHFFEFMVDEVTEEIMAYINPLVKEEAEAGRFMFPFFVRYAYRMYDGSWMAPSAPVLMIPSSGLNPLVSIIKFDNLDMRTQTNFISSSLDYQALNINEILPDLDLWAPLILGVDIFISAPIYPYDISGKIENTFSRRYSQTDPYEDPAFFLGSSPYYLGSNYSRLYGKWSMNSFYDRITYGATTPQQQLPNEALRLPYRNITEAINQGEGSIFYKLIHIPLAEITSERITPSFNNFELVNLIYQEQLPDAYSEHHQLTAHTSYVYNSRLYLADIQYKLFSGFIPELLAPHTNYPAPLYKYSCYTVIRESGRDIIVCAKTSYPIADSLGYYLYYPDIRAYKMIIIRSRGGYPDQSVTLPLKPHPTLNGAFYFDGFTELQWRPDYDPQGPPTAILPPVISPNPIVRQPHLIYSSDVLNPFHFPAEGVLSLGSSGIQSITSTTKALSQGQFGQFPLYAFTDEGIWAIEINDKGILSSRQMVSRDVCNNSKSITQLDGAVVFTSDQGVMLINGAESVNITKALAGTTFGVSKLQSFPQIVTAADLSILTEAIGDEVPLKEFLSECIISYDYPNSRLMVINPGKNYAYLYNLRNGLWSTVTSAFIHSTNNYPDSYLTDRSGRVSNLSAIISADDPRIVKGLIISRPLKLDGADILKTVSSLIHKGQFEKSQVMQVLYASRDNITFQPIASSTDSFIRRLRGTPYKSFVVVIIPSFMKRNALSKTVVDFELKYTNKLR